MQRWIAVVAAGVLALAAGCSGGGQDDPTTAPPTSSAAPTTQTPTAEPTTETPTPTPEATVTPEPTEEEVLTAEAIAALEEYVALANAVENAGGEDWQSLVEWWGTPEFIESGIEYFTMFESEGFYSVGSTEVKGIVATDFVVDPTGAGFEQVQITYCLDTTGAQMFAADGSEQIPSGERTYVADAKMQHQGSGGNWTINEQSSDRGSPC